MSKYDTLIQHIHLSKDDELTLTFNEIEQLLRSKLSDSYYLYPACWAPKNNHIGKLMLRNGIFINADIKNQKVIFKKIGSSSFEITKKPIKKSLEIKKNLNLKSINYKDAFLNFFEPYRNDVNSRYKSYDHVRNAFIEFRKDESMRDYLALMLTYYLASWGMLRNSFLMQKDYKFNLPIVEILCKSKYDELMSLDQFNFKDYQLDLILSLANEIENYYLGKEYFTNQNEKKVISNVTKTLTSKIILGVFGCVVAYDQYVSKGLRKVKIDCSFSKKSLKLLSHIIKTNSKDIKELMNLFGTENTIYTPMKVLDMIFFILGMEDKNI